MLGSGTVAEPVCMARVAWKCSTMSVCNVRITQSSSASRPNCGNSSLIPQAGLAALTEPEGRGQERFRACLTQCWAGNRLAGIKFQPGLEVERVDVENAASEENENQLLRPGGSMPGPRRQRMRRSADSPPATAAGAASKPAPMPPTVGSQKLPAIEPRCSCHESGPCPGAVAKSINIEKLVGA